MKDLYFFEKKNSSYHCPWNDCWKAM